MCRLTSQFQEWQCEQTREEERVPERMVCAHWCVSSAYGRFGNGWQVDLEGTQVHTHTPSSFCRGLIVCVVVAVVVDRTVKQEDGTHVAANNNNNNDNYWIRTTNN